MQINCAPDKISKADGMMAEESKIKQVRLAV